jgi:GNAT superfamily N-acetyltransferase
LLDRAARALPAAAEQRDRGWWLRHAGDGAWWPGAVIPHGTPGQRRAPAARRRGVARQILATIGEWAAAHGAPRLYLQAEESNHAARRLYESMGFTPLTTYHYRVSPTPATPSPPPAAVPRRG